MDGVNPTNSVLANLIFGIGDIKAQMEAIEAMARQTALKAQQAFQNTNLLSPINAQAMTAQQAKAQAVLAQGNAKIETTMAESANRQVLAREKADAAIVMSAAKSQAQVDEIRAREGINAAKSAAVQAQSRATIEAQNIKTLAVVEKTEAQRAAIVAKGEAEVSSIRARAALTRQQIAQREAATQIALTKQQVEQEKLLYMQSRRAAFEDKPQGFAGLMERRASWLVTGGLVMGGIAGLAGTLSTIKDVEMGMTTIARVTEDAAFSFKGMRDELQQLGVTYGDTWDDISDIAIRWAQAGYDMSETLELTKDSLLAVNTAELNSEQATSGFIAIMAQWGITANELLPVIDKINKVADDYAITSSDLVAGLTRSSGAAKVLGLSLEETIAILTTMREATGRTGKEVGNALNSILSFMQRPVAIKAFETEGIQVFADEARTQFRNVIEIFDEMSAKWPQMSEASRNAMADQAEAAGLYSEEMAEVLGMEQQYNDIQQRNLSQAAAGIYRRNYLLALLQNWSKVDEVLISQENSLGYSMKENERTMQTLEKQIEVLKASAEQLAVALGDSGLLNEITGLVEGITDVVQWFNGLDDSMQTALLTVAEVTIAVKLLSVALKGMGLAGIGAGAGKFVEMAKGITSVASAATLAGTAAKGLGKGIVGALGGPYAAAAIGIGTAIGFIAREANKASDELQEHAVMAEGLIGEYDSLTNKLNGMTKGTDEYNKVAQELYGLKSNIADSLPELIDGWDSETESLKINREEMQKMIDAGKELKKNKAELAANDAEISRIKEEIKASANKVQKWESEINVLNDLAERRENLTKTLATQKQGSEEAKRTEEALGETERLIADIAKEAGLKRNATIDAIIIKIGEERIAESERVKQKYVDERKLVAAAKQGALDRLKILDEEIAANKTLLPGGKWYGYTPFFLKGKNNPFGEGRIRWGLNKDQEEAAEQQKIIDAKNAELDRLDNAIKEAERNIANINADSVLGPGGSPPSIGGGGGSGSKGKEIDEIAEALKRLSESAKMFELVNMGIDSAMDAVTHKLNLANAEYDYLNSRVEAGTASSEDFARMQELLARKTALLNTEQAQLASANRQYQQQIDTLTPVLAKATAEYERFRDAGDEEHMEDAASAVSSLRSEIDSLSGAIAGNTQKIWENKGAMEQLATSAYAAYYQQTMAWMQHMEAIGRMNTDLQAEILADIDKEKLARQDAWRLEEQQFQGRLDRLKEERDRIKDAYDARMRQYESEIEANERLIEGKEKQAQSAVNGIEEQIKAIQKLMDLLDDDAESEDREEAERQHNKKLAELAEERMYHVVRTGLDHQERIKEIDDEVAEEKRRWQLQQNDWARKDQKDAYQDQIDSLKEKQKAIEKSAREEINQLKQNNDRKKQEMQKYYNEVENLLNDTNLRMLAAMGNVNDQMYQKGLDMMRNFKRGMETGSKENVAGLSDFMSDVTNQYGDYVSGGSASRPKESDYTSGSQQRLVATISPNQVKNIGGTYTLPSRTLANLLGESVEWNQQRQQVKVGSKWFSPLLNDNGTTYLSVRQVAESLGYIVKYIGSNDSVQIWDKAHDGAKVVRGGLAELRHDERVLSPQLTASFEKLASVLVKTPDITSKISGGGTADLNRVADRVIAAIERRRLLVDKLVNIETASFEDRADMQALGIEIRSMLMANG